MLLSCFPFSHASSPNLFPLERGEIFCVFFSFGESKNQRLLADTNVFDETVIAGGSLTVPLAEG